MTADSFPTSGAPLPRGGGASVVVLSILLFAASFSPAQAQKRPPVPADEPLQRIVFGSCAVQDKPQPIWSPILEEDPDLFLFAGDNIYGDTANMDTLRHEYSTLAAKPGYQKLRRTTPILATWDDHDYGANDVGGWYEQKEASEDIFLDFFNVPEDSPRRQRPGVYGAHRYGPPGKRVQVILLDTRYFRDRFEKVELSEKAQKLGFGPYVPNRDPDATMLGAKQWDWLRAQLQKPAAVRLIVSSIQVVSPDHGWEIWSQLPLERSRLFRLIEDTGAGGVLFLSGDVHWGELSRYGGGSYPLYDFTSSALNQEWPQAKNLPNPQRVGDTIYPYPNYGSVTIDWSRDDPQIQLRLHDEEGDSVLSHTVSLSALQPEAE